MSGFFKVQLLVGGTSKSIWIRWIKKKKRVQKVGCLGRVLNLGGNCDQDTLYDILKELIEVREMLCLP